MVRASDIHLLHFGTIRVNFCRYVYQVHSFYTFLSLVYVKRPHRQLNIDSKTAKKSSMKYPH